MPIDVTYAKTSKATIQPNNHAPRPKRIERDNPLEGKEEPTILIIGAGTFGTSAAYHLAHLYKDPSKVTIIDSCPSPPKRAASIDLNRVIRTDYASKLYCDLACETIHPWFWSSELGPYFHKVGWLMFEEEGSTLKQRIRETFEGRGSTQARDVELGSVQTEWPCLEGTKLEGFQGAYFNPEAGWCDAAEATHAFMQAAVSKGVRRETGTVTSLLHDPSTSSVTGVLTSDGRTFSASKILLAAGSWTSQLLSRTEETLSLPPSQRIESQIQATGLVAAYYRPSSSSSSQISSSFNNKSPTPPCPVVIYGSLGEIIPPSPTNHLIKYANSKSGIINTILPFPGAAKKISIPAANQSLVPEILKKETMEQMTANVMPKFVTKGQEPEYWRICWDAQTPTEDFLICKHPYAQEGGLENLYLATGGSFHGYKCVFSSPSPLLPSTFTSSPFLIRPILLLLNTFEKF